MTQYRKIIWDGGWSLWNQSLRISQFCYIWESLKTVSLKYPKMPPTFYKHLQQDLFCLIHHDSPENISFVRFFCTIQGSFPSSNKVITYGLGMKRPAYRKNTELVWDMVLREEMPSSQKRPKEGWKNVCWNRKVSYRQGTTELYISLGTWKRNSAIYSGRFPSITVGDKTKISPIEVEVEVSKL